MMPGAVTVQDSDVITTGPTHSIGGAGARQGRGVGGRGAQQTEGRGEWGEGGLSLPLFKSSKECNNAKK